MIHTSELTPTSPSREKSSRLKSALKHIFNKKILQKFILTLFIFSQKKSTMQDAFRKKQEQINQRGGQGGPDTFKQEILTG